MKLCMENWLRGTTTRRMHMRTVGSRHQPWRRTFNALKGTSGNRRKDANDLVDIIKRKEVEMKNKDHEITELWKKVENCRRDGPKDEATNHEWPAIRDLTIVHSRYQAVRAAMEKKTCSLWNAFRFAGISRSTVRDFRAIAELKVVDNDAYESILRDFS